MFPRQPQDVLDRFYKAAQSMQADVIVRITADCPVIDPALIDETVQVFLGEDIVKGPFDFAASRLPPPFTRTYPIGQDIEVCAMSGLEKPGVKPTSLSNAST
jgi:spore coat polysaccharide biosynthesis protein SpsF